MLILDEAISLAERDHALAWGNGTRRSQGYSPIDWVQEELYSLIWLGIAEKIEGQKQLIKYFVKGKYMIY
jgi:hypothetical protein